MGSKNNFAELQEASFVYKLPMGSHADAGEGKLV